MRIGVVVPTYNQAKWLPGAYLSAVGGWNYCRSSVHLDVVVVDDGSTDTTPKLLRSLAPDVVTQANQGTAAAINAGAERLTDADALTWISSDNAMNSGWADVLGDTMQEHNAGAVYGGFYWCGPNRVAYHFTPYDPDRLINDVNCFFGPAFLIRADVWREAGPHRGKISHDYDHWLRVEEVCWRRGLPIVGVDEPLCYYMAHDERVTVTRAHEFDAPHWQAEARKRRGLA